jgi:hypothetical protein
VMARMDKTISISSITNLKIDLIQYSTSCYNEWEKARTREHFLRVHSPNSQEYEESCLYTEIIYDRTNIVEDVSLAYRKDGDARKVFDTFRLNNIPYRK